MTELSAQVTQVVSCATLITLQIGRRWIRGERFEAQPMYQEEHEVTEIKKIKPGDNDVELRVALRITGSTYFGKGEWDKIPYSVEVSSTVHVCCQDVTTADPIAYEFAHTSAEKHLKSSVERVVHSIEHDIYPELFGNQGDA